MVDAGQPPLFKAKLSSTKAKDIEVKNQEAADKIVAAVSKAKWQVASVAQKEKKRQSPPPFTRRKLQQAAYNRLRYTAMRTDVPGTELYEAWNLVTKGSVALITYMRTDSVARLERRAGAGPRNDSGALWRELSSEKTELLQIEKGRAGSHEAVASHDAMRAPEDVRKYSTKISSGF